MNSSIAIIAAIAVIAVIAVLFLRKKNTPAQDKEKPAQGEVIAVGPGGVVDGKEIKMEVKPGQHIVYSRYAGTDVELDGEKFVIIRQGDVLAIIEG